MATQSEEERSTDASRIYKGQALWQRNAPEQHQRRSRPSSRWLLTEIESCFKLCRQVFLSHFSLFLHSSCSSSSVSTPSLTETETEEEALWQYSQTILHELFQLIDLIVTSSEDHAHQQQGKQDQQQQDITELDLMNQPKLISSLLNSLLSAQRKDRHIGHLLAMGQGGAHHSHLRFWRAQVTKIVADIFIGLCYGSLSKKLQGWSEVLHMMLACLLQLSSPGETEAEAEECARSAIVSGSAAITALLCEIGEQMFLSEACYSAWVLALSRQGMDPQSHPRAVLYREDGPRTITGTETGGGAGVRFLSLEEAKGRFLEEFQSIHFPGPGTVSLTRKAMRSICCTVVNRFRIEL
jgi:hypothetical protein